MDQQIIDMQLSRANRTLGRILTALIAIASMLAMALLAK